MPLTPSQQAAVCSAREPLFIEAGAGTGKTFTLTKRIARGLSQESGPLIAAVDRMLTITFTNKAAGELIGRVRAELRAQGLAEEALQIDAAWVSTIHSMCRRILLAHAFEAGIDPGAALLSEDETKALSSFALDELLLDHAGDMQLSSLFAHFGVEAATRLISQMSALLELAPGGLASFDLGPSAGTSSAGTSMVIELLAEYRQGLDEIDAIGVLADKSTYVKNRDAMSQVVSRIESWPCLRGEPASWQDIAALLDALPLLDGRRYKEPYGSVFGVCRQTMLEAKSTARCALSRMLLDFAAQYAVRHLEHHRHLKHVQGALDTNDLLIATYRLFEQRPDIAREYREQFDSVMVDEFQDTDSLQVGIVRHVCDDDLSTLTTVGDAQQSIYGFRGADIEVFRDMRMNMQAHGSREVELAVNYRSQPDILRFVEDIFAKPEFFGASFLKVESGRKKDSDPAWLKLDEPRVKILLSAGTKASKGSGKTSIERLRAADARAVADEFERLHAQGASYGDMAILMQSVKSLRSGPYLRELRSRGIPCIVSGGSDFYTLPEVSTVVMLLRVLANRDDDEALFELLGSSLFDVCDDDLLVLSVATRQRLKIMPEESRAKASLFDALRYCVRGPHMQVSPTLELVLDVLEHALSAMRRMPLSQLVLDVVELSGWKATLGQRGIEGGAVYANIERMCDMIDDFECLNGRSVFEASEYFRDMVDLAREGTGARAKLGTLVSSGSGAVRIMTIHSSKGLEFPIVAVAEFEKDARIKDGELITLTEQGKRYLSLGIAGTGHAVAHIVKDADDPGSFAAAQDASAFCTHAIRLSKERAYQEQQRLFYVALTRARDELIIACHDGSFGSKGELPENLTGDFMRAVFGSELPVADAVVRTKAGALVNLDIASVPYEEGDLEPAHAREDSPGVKHAYPAFEALPRISSFVPPCEGIYSYSSIAHRAQEKVVPVAQAIVLSDRSSRADTVSAVGSAFHLVAQWLAAVPVVHEQALDARLQAVVKRYELDEDSEKRLVDAVGAWMSSDCFARAQSYEQRYAEYAFCVDVEGVALEGYIDLLCFDSDGSALVIDYKTGTSGQGEDLHDRYALQAACYAYALLSTGLCAQLEMVFVRPEAGMEEVRFEFEQGDVSALTRSILSCKSE